MRKIGTITRLQIQTDSLKQGQRPYTYYDPSPLLAVPALRLTARGCVGLHDGREIIDVHHVDHTQSKHMRINGISFNFTTHYQKMQQRFGTHLATGCAGENILIASDAVFAEDAFAQALIVETSDGQHVRLNAITVAAPCAPFSTYALCLEWKPPAEMMRETLQFLDGGTRGFYCTLAGEAMVVRVGDQVFLDTQ